jgi:thiamine-monophosphate kinase
MTPGRDEFDVIDALRTRFQAAGTSLGAGDVGIGDDAAVVTPPGSTAVVLATDLVVEGVHVDLGTSSPEDVGWKALMVAVSDIGAMGCTPSHVLLSVAAPVGFPIERLGDGVAEAAAAAGCTVVGGDLASSPHGLVVSVAAVGPAGEGVPPLRRSGARPGDRVLVTGPLGASAAGLRRLSAGDGRDVPVSLAAAHRRPVARLEEGAVARRAGVRAAIDVSDGLAADVVHLARSSGVGLELRLPAEAVAAGAEPTEAVSGGEDYELVLATPDPDRLRGEFHIAGLRAPIDIGVCTDHVGEWLLDGQPLPVTGWRHRF